LSYTELAQVHGFVFAAGLRQGYGYTQWSEDSGATNFEAAIQVSGVPADYQTPGFCLGPAGQWFCALTQSGQVRIYRSETHCATGGWQLYQTVE